RGSPMIIALEAADHSAHGALRVSGIDVHDLVARESRGVEADGSPWKAAICAGLDYRRVGQHSEVDRIGSAALLAHKDQRLLPLDGEWDQEARSVLKGAVRVSGDDRERCTVCAVQEDKHALTRTEPTA